MVFLWVARLVIDDSFLCIDLTCRNLAQGSGGRELTKFLKNHSIRHAKPID